MSLKAQALHGAFWSFLERMGQQGIQFVITIILARFLMPEQFGLIAMLAIFIEVAKEFMDSGFAAALIQRKQATEVDECSVFYFNIVVGVLAAGLLYASAPWIAGFYHQPVLVPLTRVLSLTLVIDSLGAVQTALLSKRIDFKTLLKVGMAATLLSGAVGIALAIQGFGVWSLVAQSVGRSLFRTVFVWALAAWRPRLLFSLAALRELFGFGSHLLGSYLLNTIFENLYPLIIGKLFSATHLGLYAGAKKIERLVTANLTYVATRVAFPVFSTIQDDPGRLKHSMRKALRVLALVHFPLMVGLALVAPPLVRVLLTEKWAPAIGWLQLLCLANLMYPIHALHLNLLKGVGRSDLFLRVATIQKALVFPLVLITYRWGVTGMIWGQVALTPLGYYLNSYYVVRLIHYSLREQLFDLAPYAAATVLMAVGVHLVSFLPLAGDTLPLVLKVLVGASLYVALNCFFGLSAFVEIAGAVRDKLSLRFPSLVRS